jgi:hypothetical protein
MKLINMIFEKFKTVGSLVPGIQKSLMVPLTLGSFGIQPLRSTPARLGDFVKLGLSNSANINRNFVRFESAVVERRSPEQTL